MDYKIVNKQNFADRFKRLDIRCPDIAGKVRPGQFVKVCPVQGGGVDPAGRCRDRSVARDHRGDRTGGGPGGAKAGCHAHQPVDLFDPGAAGHADPYREKGVVVCIATGIGIARILPVARALKQAGNKVIGIIGARTRRELLLEAQMRIASNKIFVATDDGSREYRGLATDLFKRVMGEEKVQGFTPSARSI